ncbi:MAG TPA: hypothetical protein VEQ65_01205, partial [Opitutus sp.]|nr:hypothetical protein [Opitutus sp.]
FVTARRLQQELGGRIVFFFHDSDHDPRETQTTLRHRTTDEPFAMNFAVQNRLQRKFSPLHLKTIAPGWRETTARQLGAYVEPRLVDLFKSVAATNVADFCLELYRRLGLLDGIDVVRSSDPAVRTSACDITDFFADLPYGGEIVRARCIDGAFKLHEGGDSYLTLPPADITKAQISPTRDSRLRWMQSVIHCTHYIAGAGEQAYLNPSDAPEITFIKRDDIDRSDEAHVQFPV